LFKKNEVGNKNQDFKRIELVSQEAEVLEAPDPSNIVWEDLGITGKKLKCNGINANLLMCALVLLAFFFFWFLRTIPNDV